MRISIDEINWFFNRPYDLLNCKDWIRNQFISFVIDVGDFEMIKWIFEHSTELKITKRKLSKKLFHRAITGPSNGGHVIKENNIDYPLLYWLHGNINLADLFNGSGSIRMSLFILIFSSESNKLLDWLFSNIPDLFKGKDNEGRSFFHYAAFNSTPDIIKWLYAHIPELVYYKDNTGKKAFDIAVDNDNPGVINWIKDNIPDNFSLAS